MSKIVVSEFLGDRFLDRLREDHEVEYDPDLYAQQHLLARLILSGDTLQVGILNDEWFVQMIDDDAIKVPFVEMSSGYLITASAEQMRPVIIKYADDPDAFPIAALVRVGD